MTILLRMKHWQIFLILICLPIILHLWISKVEIFNQNVNDLISTFDMPVIFITTLFFWLYTLASNLNNKLTSDFKLNIKKFIACLIVPLFYFLLLFFFVLEMSEINYTTSFIILIFVIGVPLHLLSMFCIFYCFWFNAKLLSSVELQKEGALNEYIGYFFLFWFYPIGIWIIQPKINIIFNKKTD